MGLGTSHPGEGRSPGLWFSGAGLLGDPEKRPLQRTRPPFQTDCAALGSPLAPLWLFLLLSTRAEEWPLHTRLARGRGVSSLVILFTCRDLPKRAGVEVIVSQLQGRLRRTVWQPSRVLMVNMDLFSIHLSHSH